MPIKQQNNAKLVSYFISENKEKRMTKNRMIHRTERLAIYTSTFSFFVLIYFYDERKGRFGETVS